MSVIRSHICWDPERSSSQILCSRLSEWLLCRLPLRIAYAFRWQWRLDLSLMVQVKVYDALHTGNVWTRYIARTLLWSIVAVMEGVST